MNYFNTNNNLWDIFEATVGRKSIHEQKVLTTCGATGGVARNTDANADPAARPSARRQTGLLGRTRKGDQHSETSVFRRAHRPPETRKIRIPDIPSKRAIPGRRTHTVRTNLPFAARARFLSRLRTTLKVGRRAVIRCARPINSMNK